MTTTKSRLKTSRRALVNIKKLMLCHQKKKKKKKSKTGKHAETHQTKIDRCNRHTHLCISFQYAVVEQQNS